MSVGWLVGRLVGRLVGHSLGRYCPPYYCPCPTPNTCAGLCIQTCFYLSAFSLVTHLNDFANEGIWDNSSFSSALELMIYEQRIFSSFFNIKERWVSRQGESKLLQKACKHQNCSCCLQYESSLLLLRSHDLFTIKKFWELTSPLFSLKTRLWQNLHIHRKWNQQWVFHDKMVYYHGNIS